MNIHCFFSGIGIYVEESEYTINSSITNNTNLYLKRVYCGQCKIISFYCYSNTTDIGVVMNYPKRLSSRRYYDYRIGAYRYREIDPWQIQYQPNNESLYMSVVRSSSNDIAVGTYSCEERSDNSLFLQTQIMSFGIYRDIDGKLTLRLYIIKFNMSNVFYEL